LNRRAAPEEASDRADSLFASLTFLRFAVERRNSPRDTEKLHHFDEFVEYMQLETPPPVPHMTIDNRLTAHESLEAQIANLVATANT
jgi:hypothetical protein